MYLPEWHDWWFTGKERLQVLETLASIMGRLDGGLDLLRAVYGLDSWQSSTIEAELARTMGELGLEVSTNCWQGYGMSQMSSLSKSGVGTIRQCLEVTKARLEEEEERRDSLLPCGKRK